MKKLIIIIFCSLFLFSGCSDKITYSSQNTFALDTLVNIKVYYRENEGYDESITREAFVYISEMENILSVHIEGSDLYNLKMNAGKNFIDVDDLTMNLIMASIEYSDMSEGLFDITAGPLIDLWDIRPPYGYVPTGDELSAALELIGYEKITLNDGQIKLKGEGMVANLGAIAKGNIADKVKTFLISKGVNSGIINLGGNVLLIGSKPDGENFSVGVQAPGDERGRYLLSINISDKALVTSGDYERYFIKDGKEYHHILDPFTGYPTDNNIKQVSIVAENSTVADAMSTTVLLMGLNKGIGLIESMDNLESVIITKDNLIYITEGLRDMYVMEEIFLGEYTIVDSFEEMLED